MLDKLQPPLVHPLLNNFLLIDPKKKVAARWAMRLAIESLQFHDSGLGEDDGQDWW